jgi:hypothetical protein
MNEYIIVFAATPQELAKLVTSKLGAGYSLHGSPFSDPQGTNYRYNQAMTK